MNFTTVHSEGALLSAELLYDIYRGEAAGQAAQDFQFARKALLSDEIALSWGKARVLWAGFHLRLQRLNANAPATQETRQYWILPLLQLKVCDPAFGSGHFLPAASAAR